MKRVGLFFFLVNLSLLFLSCGQLSESEEIIWSVNDEFAPDKRVAIFDVTAEKQSGQIRLKGETNLTAAMEILEKRLTDAGITYINHVQMLPDLEALDNKCRGVITVSVANIRVTPSNGAEMATQAILGTPVRIYKKNEKGSYYYIQTPDGYLGWIDNNSVKRINQEKFDAWRKASRIIYLEDNGYVFKKPDVQSRKVSDLTAGNILEKTGKEGSFYKIRFPDSREGYVLENESMDFKRWLKTRNPSTENIIETSYRFIGLPYLWGGTSTKMMDCSGFTKMVFFLNGIILPRDASQQVYEGILLTEDPGRLEKVDPASLVFFGRKATEDSPQRVWHVGLWLGEGLMIHEDGPLKIESLDPNVEPFNKRRYDTFFSARNFIDAIGEGQLIPVQEHDWYVMK
jgi:gamma-D-glutamyl-L-lysine dipeptidyl-peptidase